ncbi:Cytochrome P450 [Apodemus speciosus]|uniref:Cytochrome P450 n=1 Tax=Apodemus speciosus TaxID=105296 RepID=A0ABQ0FK46_APOSI
MVREKDTAGLWMLNFPEGKDTGDTVARMCGHDVTAARLPDMFSLQTAWKPVVVINGLKAMQEVLVTCGEDTADPPRIQIYENLGFGPKSRGKGLREGAGVDKTGVTDGLVGSRDRTGAMGTVIVSSHTTQSCRVWSLHLTGPSGESRGDSVSTLCDFGLGKKSLEHWVTEEAGYLCDALTAQAGSPLNPYPLLDKAVCNVIASLVYVCLFMYGDPFLTRILKMAEEHLEELSGFIPERLADKVFPLQKLFIAMLEKQLTERKMSWDPAQPPCPPKTRLKWEK